jgi:hypothetical protein
MESGADQHDVMEYLGHANITTTSRYLKSTPLRLERALAKMEAENPDPTPVFAHDSHTAPKQGATPITEAPASAPQKHLIQ